MLCKAVRVRWRTCKKTNNTLVLNVIAFCKTLHKMNFGVFSLELSVCIMF